MDINDFRKLWSEDRVQLTNHGLKRLELRNISIDDVGNCIMNGEIIEEYPEDYPHPSALIFGHTIDGKIIHVVCGISEETLYLITAYEPTTEKFLDDLKTRRQR